MTIQRTENRNQKRRGEKGKLISEEVRGGCWGVTAKRRRWKQGRQGCQGRRDHPGQGRVTL